MKKTLVVWRRFGKEHGEGPEFKVNSPEVVSAHIRKKTEAFRKTNDDDWRWYQPSEKLIVEKPFPGEGFGPTTVIYYLLDRSWTAMENIHFSGLGREWTWYVHVGDTDYYQAHNTWVFADHFADIIIKDDLNTHSVLDLDDLSQAYELGLVTGTKLVGIMGVTQELIDMVRAGDFPPPELDGREEIKNALGWA